MQHLRTGRKFGRVKNQRTAMLRSLLGSLIMQEKIETTEAKAKEVKTLIDRFIKKAKEAQVEAKKVSATRQLRSKLSAEAVKKLTGEFTNRFAERNSGYTRIIKLSPRKSDSARMAIIEFV